MLPPRDDLHFWIYDWLKADTLAAMPAFAHVDRDTGVAMLDAALDLAASHFLPHAAASDQNPPKLVDGKVEPVEHLLGAERLGHVAENDLAHPNAITVMRRLDSRIRMKVETTATMVDLPTPAAPPSVLKP